jgi:hypothetical protein
MDIQDIIPLREITDPQHIAPWFKTCFKPREQPFKFALKKALLEELGLEAPESDQQIAEDPFLLLGYGINAFFDLLSSLSTMFVWITIFFIPLFYIYSSHEAYYDQKSWPISRLMLGNLGGSSIFC